MSRQKVPDVYNSLSEQEAKLSQRDYALQASSLNI